LKVPYSEEGTLLHRLDANQDEPRGELINQQQREVLERNESLRQQFLDRELPRLGISPDAKVVKFVEREFLLCDFDGEPLISHGQKVPGHPDLIYWYPDFLVAIIFDSKFGRIEVSPAWLNLQLKSYFVMFCENFSPETVIVAITQPWAKASKRLPQCGVFSKRPGASQAGVDRHCARHGAGERATLCEH
jgi:hypothetical protein